MIMDNGSIDNESEYQESRQSTSLFNKHVKEVLFGAKSCNVFQTDN